ncbi:MAG: chromosome segregation protein SMC [Pseudomonadota bacterium]
MHFTRLRLSGFKSFVDPTELWIEPGLTGVVGPNGCGKSNLLEALRWVMGEHSARSLRSGGMDDVIFAGTARRPARNIAEVALAIDNRDRNAPAAFNDSDDLLISRRIERELGSSYRINGRDVRQKDVQLLFADAATGAQSPSIVSQGRVGELINAKPADRRKLLEEAAGISGLHSRRKEAQSRLKSAETNLERLTTVIDQLKSQMNGLNRQARQAESYKKLSATITRLSAILAFQKWRAECDAIRKLDDELESADAEMRRVVAAVAKLSTQETEVAARIPALRDEEIRRAAAVTRITHERDDLDRAERDRAAKLQAVVSQRASAEGDLDRARSQAEDAKSTVDQILKDLGETDAELTEAETRRPDLEDQLERCEAELAEALEAYSKAQSAHKEAEALNQATIAARKRADEMIARRAREVETIQEALAKAREQSASEDQPAPQDLANEAEMARNAAESASLALKQYEDAAEREEKHFRDIRHQQNDAESAAAAATSRRDMLRKLVGKHSNKASSDQTWALADADVTPGYEKAIAAALGWSAEAIIAEVPAALSENRWQTLPVYAEGPDAPTGTKRLAEFVKTHPSLARRVAHTFVLESEPQSAHEIDQIMEGLPPGVSVVSKSGKLWRWDGFAATGSFVSEAARRIEQQNELTAAEAELAPLAAALTETKVKFEQQKQALTDADRKRDDARRALQQAEHQAVETANAARRAEARASEQRDRLQTLERRLADAEGALAAEVQTVATTADEQVQPEALETLAHTVAASKDAWLKAQAARDAARSRLQELNAQRTEAQRRKERLRAEAEAWATRGRDSAEHIETLNSRLQQLATEAEKLATPDGGETQKREALTTQLADSEAARQRAADQLAEAEMVLAEARKQMNATKEAEARAREMRARLETGHEGHRTRRQEIAHEIGETFHCPPIMVLSTVGIDETEEADLPPSKQIETELEAIKAKRERLGPVNLRASVELDERKEELSGLTREFEDLEHAIAKLRGAIGALNREGRQLLMAAFDEVNQHFGTLFQTLFGGGEAHLSLIESDDPLSAGLEIMASPPGKRLQSLSLLSGGEQALTALALIFAVFMTHPAPICVLDEVDAPLDDANVERFCNLLDAMGARTDTRFLIVTHNAVTMSRMNRLFGVTMVEKGISKLVSVDLARAPVLAAAE